MKKVLAFDLDGTLTESKTVMEDRMSELLNRLLDHFHICVISGGSFEQFKKQFIAGLQVAPARLERLHLMPTCGTSYYIYDITTQDWRKVYAEDLTHAQKEKIRRALSNAFKASSYWPKKTWGELVEDRGSQVTLSTLGQEAPREVKEAWDPDNRKKYKLRDLVAELLPEFEVRTGGLTSIDVTKPGIDKAYGMKRLSELLGISQDEILFFGDRVNPGGNDYPVKAMGVDTLEISSWKDTANALEAILHVTT